MNPSTPAPHHRHQSSLEGFFSLSPRSPLDSTTQSHVKRRFYKIINHLEAAESSDGGGPYNRPRLLRLTYEYARSEESQDTFLQAFFYAMNLPLDRDENEDGDDVAGYDASSLFSFADYLLDHFFLPRKIETSKT